MGGREGAFDIKELLDIGLINLSLSQAFARLQTEHPEVMHRAHTRESHVARDNSSTTLEPAHPGKGSLDRVSLQENVNV